MTEADHTETEAAYELRMQSARQAHEDRKSHIKYLNQSTIDMSTTAIKSLLLINGGAAVAMLGFLASATNPLYSSGAVDFSQIATALVWFAVGVGSVGLCSGLTYCVLYLQVGQLSGVTFTWEYPYIIERKSQRWWAIGAGTLQAFAVLVGFFSIACFGFGVAQFANLFLDGPQTP